MKAKIEAYQGKIKLCQEEQVHIAEEKERKKDTDLVEKNAGDRKNLRKVEQRNVAAESLAERRCYQFVEIKQVDGEEEPVMISIKGTACRTPAEDITWEEQ